MRPIALTATALALTLAGCSGDGGCEDHPICAALRNSGAYGGYVRTSLNDARTEAVVETNSLPDYQPGPYGANPNTAQAQQFTFRIPLAPSPGPAAAGVGHVAVAWNGVSLFNPADARNIGGCTGNAAFLESNHVDRFGGHPTARGEYHYHSGEFLKHAEELGLRNSAAEHSSLVGFSFDGLPIYGPFAFSDPNDAASAIQELRSCYRLKSARTCCQDTGLCSLTSTFDQKTLVMGAFVEDFEHDATALAEGRCDLDEFNSRVAVTPEYGPPTRLYVMTFDANGNVAFPFIFGTRYWGQLL